MQTDTLAALRLIPLELAVLLNENHKNYHIAADLYLENVVIVQPRGSSNWQGYSAVDNKARMDAFIEFLYRLLQGTAPLTWSDRGASTEGAHINQFLRHIGVWPLNVVEGLEMSSSSTSSIASVGTSRIGSLSTLQDQEPRDSAIQSTSGNTPTLDPNSPSPTWMQLLFAEADRIKAIVEEKKLKIHSNKLPLPSDDPPRDNIELGPLRYDMEQYRTSTVYFWKYIYNDSTPTRPPEFTTNCGKWPNQKYWIATYAAGEKRQRLARIGLKPSCLEIGADEVVIWTPEDLDAEYKQRNAKVLSDPRGEGNWTWKHYVQYSMLERLGPEDILFYIDSDMNCTTNLHTVWRTRTV